MRGRTFINLHVSLRSPHSWEHRHRGTRREISSAVLGKNGKAQRRHDDAKRQRRTTTPTTSTTSTTTGDGHNVPIDNGCTLFHARTHTVTQTHIRASGHSPSRTDDDESHIIYRSIYIIVLYNAWYALVAYFFRPTLPLARNPVATAAQRARVITS